MTTPTSDDEPTEGALVTTPTTTPDDDGTLPPLTHASPVTPGAQAHATFLGIPPFPAAARTALADTQLRRNLAHATGTIRDKRAAVVAEVPDWEALRQRAARTKDDTLAHLDEHLLTLEAALTERGATVHRAHDAADACAVVADVARAHGIRDLVKVKSMATQEIGLNEALADHGIAAWETDLAELIVQLGGDLPSHILVPAIHRNRSEIRQIFRDRMASAGRPAPEDLSDDPAALAAAARSHLREKFLSTRMSVSGANFAVAESGTLVVVESEGNGRMCLTLPDVLVSVVGIEKVLPTWQDLDVFLRLLPRSSTGERMNPYTSTWSGVTPGDGPQEVHVVLLDNGRTRALADEYARQALRCIRCSACLNVCPVYERVGGHTYGSVYPGPIGAILNPILRGVGEDAQVDSLPYASTLCGACGDVCPVAIDIPGVLVHLRSKVVDAHRGDRVPKAEALAMRAASWGLSDAGRLRRAERVAGVVGRVVRGRGMPGGRPAMAWLPWPGTRWTQARDLPAPPQESFREWWRRAGRREGKPQRGEEPATNLRDTASGAPAASPGVHRGSPVVHRPASSDRAGMLDLFVARVADYRAVVTRCAAADLTSTVRQALAAADTVVVPLDLGIEVAGAVVDDGIPARDLDGIDAVVTGSALAIAETGTVVLDHGPGQGRRAVTLLPDLHVCVVREGSVVRDVPDAVALLDPLRPQTWISGPSATSDIELDRVEGVHGPRRLHVVLVSEA